MLYIKNIFYFENGDLCFCLVSLNIPYATFPKIGLQIQNIEAVNMTLMQKNTWISWKGHQICSFTL